MKDLLLGQEPAYPNTPITQLDGETILGSACFGSQSSGMSKRFYAACSAMQGLMANAHPTYILMSIENMAHWAYSAADELLKQETKTE